MYRYDQKLLESWIEKDNRKPLVIRGARQVGKSTLVRNFARAQGMDLVELNLETHLKLKSGFETFSTTAILNEISALTNKAISEQLTLLFLD